MKYPDVWMLPDGTVVVRNYSENQNDHFDRWKLATRWTGDLPLEAKSLSLSSEMRKIAEWLLAEKDYLNESGFRTLMSLFDQAEHQACLAEEEVADLKEELAAARREVDDLNSPEALQLAADVLSCWKHKLLRPEVVEPVITLLRAKAEDTQARAEKELAVESFAERGYEAWRGTWSSAPARPQPEWVDVPLGTRLHWIAWARHMMRSFRPDEAYSKVGCYYCNKLDGGGKCSDCRVDAGEDIY